MALLQTFRQTRLASAPSINRPQVRHANTTSFPSLLKSLAPSRNAKKATTLPYRPLGTEAGNYAAALWQLTADNQTAKETEQQLSKFRSAEFKKAQKTLNIGTLAHQKDKLDRLIKTTGVNADVQKVFKLLLQNNKLALVNEVAEEYYKLQLASRGETLAQVILPSEKASQKTKDEISSYLSQMTSLKPLIEYKYNPSLGSGFRISAGGFFVDKSGKTATDKAVKQLSEVHKRELAKIQTPQSIPTKLVDVPKLDLPPPIWETMTAGDFDQKALAEAVQHALKNPGDKSDDWFNAYFAKHPTATDEEAKSAYYKANPDELTRVPVYQEKVLQVLSQ